MQLTLVDESPGVVRAWQQAFADLPDIDIHCGDILCVAENTLVSPANSYGYMDGGIDRTYLDFFGLDLQVAVLDAIARRPEGYLPVGASVLVATKHPRIPYLIVAPTMMVPEPVPPVHAYQAMMATLRIAHQYPRQIQHVYCPGLGTGIGEIPPPDAAHEMALAYRQWKARVTQGRGPMKSQQSELTVITNEKPIIDDRAPGSSNWSLRHLPGGAK